MTEQEIGRRVGDFIKTNFLFDERGVDIDESLLGSGTVDSTGILEVITFLEQSFQIHFEDRELVGENFDTVRRIQSFVFQKLNDGHLT